MNRTQLTTIDNLDFNLIEFSKPEQNNIPGQKVTYSRVRVGIRKDGELCDLIIPSPANLTCWGLQENRDMVTQALNGYQLPIALWSNGAPKPEEKQFTDKFNELCEYVKKHLVENRDELGKYDLELNDLKKFNPLYWKMEKGKIVEGRGPTLYAKCMYDKKNEKVNTIFVNEETQEMVNPLSVLGKHANVHFALKIEGIFIGTRISFQVKLHEVMFRLKDTGMRSLLCPNATLSTTFQDTVEDSDDSDDEEEEVEEEVVEEEVEEEVEEPLPVEPVVKTVEPTTTARKPRAKKTKA